MTERILGPVHPTSAATSALRPLFLGAVTFEAGSLFGAWQHRSMGTVDWVVARRLVPTGLVGAVLGVVSVNRLPARPCRIAFALFDRAWKDFETLEMEADAALVALELAETLLVVGEPGRVPQICRALLDRFTRAGMTSRAITALSYLREVVAIGKAQPPVIRQVREFLRELPSQGRPTLTLPLHEPER